MPKLKNLSAQDIIKILQFFGFSIVKQRGSHIKLQRKLDDRNQTITIPNHKTLDKGTSKAIFNQLSKYISRSELITHFYSE